MVDSLPLKPPRSKLRDFLLILTIQLFAIPFEPALNHMVGKASYGEFTHRQYKSPTPITDATWARHNCKEMWAFGRERRPTGNWHTARTIVLFLLPSGLHMKHVRLMTFFWFFGVFSLAWVIFAQYMSMVLRQHSVYKLSPFFKNGGERWYVTPNFKGWITPSPYFANRVVFSTSSCGVSNRSRTLVFSVCEFPVGHLPYHMVKRWFKRYCKEL